MNAIVIVDKNWGIGRDNNLLVHLPSDLKYFKEKTTGKVIVIGRKTLESFPGGRPLPDRLNIVLTGNENYKNDHCTVCVGEESLEKELLKHDEEDVFISGGESIYEQFIEKCNVVYVTKMDAEFVADKYFPNLDESDLFKMTWESEPMKENGIRYRFTKYERCTEPAL